MASNFYAGDIKQYRKMLVSRMRCRGLNMEAITSSLAVEFGLVNPDTNLPYSSATIGHDLKELEAEWQEQALANVAGHKGRIFAELQEVKRAAWDAGKLDIVLSAILRECKMLGLDEPVNNTLTIELGEGLKEKLNTLADRYETYELPVEHRASALPDSNEQPERLLQDLKTSLAAPCPRR